MRASDRGCPFCGAALTVVATVPSAVGRLARGALFAFASSVVACGGTTAAEPTSAGDTGASDARGDTPFDSRINDTRMDDTGNIAPPYGIPPEDSGLADDTGDPMADYGAPPPPADGG